MSCLACIDWRSMSYPNTSTEPASASTSEDRMRISVDLPDPLAPMSPKISPRPTWNDTSCTARTRRGGLRDQRWAPGVNVLETLRTANGVCEARETSVMTVLIRSSL